MKVHIAISLVLLFSLSLVSCQKDASINNSGSDNGSTIRFSLKASNPYTALNRMGVIKSATRTEGANIQWTSAVASVMRVKMEGKKGDSEVEYKTNVQQTIDLLEATSQLGDLSLPAGNFTKVEFKILLSPNGNTPALEIRGQFANGTTTTNVVFRANEDVEIKGEKSAINLTDSSLHQAITSLDLALLTRGISASDLSAAAGTGNDLLITSEINSNLYRMILKNLKELEHEEEFH